MRFIPALALAAAVLLSGGGVVSAQENLESLRGKAPISQELRTDNMFRPEKDQDIIPRNFQKQPPLIPHSIKGYNITQNFNKCMDCHAWQKTKQTGATKVSVTHFRTREGQELDNISPRRYFCTQCHVPQKEVQPLVGNSFENIDQILQRQSADQP